MAPVDSQQHVMSFQDASLFCWVTKKSNAAGVDGFAQHTDGLPVVQCKRYAEDNSVGRPAVQRLQGVLEVSSVWRGFIATTGYFTRDALDSAFKSGNPVLIGLDELVARHSGGIDASQFSGATPRRMQN